ncbi:MAG: S46 family peptidase [Crocinitomicaceae bacterium]|nr:S46 family peptidase [Crocinitomicaceae bacterium]
MKKLIITFTFSIIFAGQALSVEGMWIPSLIDMFYSDMQTYGLKLSKEQIYSTNNSSLKDAVIQFNGGCTAEIVSDQGLILTNHHCGYDAIQKHSSIENDYLANGFWSKNFSEELPCPWLNITIVKEIRDVTEAVLSGVDKTANAEEIQEKIKKNIALIEAEEKKKSGYAAKIKPFSQGNEYFMLITQNYEDIRLVGTPPNAIGKFGGDTDNWVWPRHTGDFSVFRIYADNNNQPAEYSADNVPYKPAYSLPISLKPKQIGDFTMVYGFPGYTDQHYTASKLKFYIETEAPARINMRQHTLDLMKPAMNANDTIRIQYSAKQASIANAWKKWIGQLGGLNELDAIGKKITFEEEYRARAAERTEWKEKYGKIIDELDQLQAEYGRYEFARNMYIEYFYYGPEIISFAFDFYELAFRYDELESEGKLEETITGLKNNVKSFYKDYNAQLDQSIFHELTPLYAGYVSTDLLPEGFIETWEKTEVAIYTKSIFSDREKLELMLDKFSAKSAKKLQKDPTILFAIQIYSAYYDNVVDKYKWFMVKEDELMQRYVEGMIVMFPDKKMWSDANSTMRIAYGKIDGSQPYDGMQYLHYTTIDGIMQKYDPKNPDFELTDRFIELYNKKDFGEYAQDGELWVCFTASNHTTGGNSGSPVIDGEGNLIGINFDRSWESTMSDFMFDESRCRNIVVDIRYVLWVIDKYGDAHHLIEEMNIVR